MSLLVSFAGRGVGESLVAVPAAERLLPRVNAHVSFEITGVGEFLPTVLKKEEKVMEKQQLQCETEQLHLSTVKYEDNNNIKPEG